MQRNERISRGAGGDTYVQPLTTSRGTATPKKTSLCNGNNIPQRPGTFGTPAPLLGSPSEFRREALLRGFAIGPKSRVSQDGDSQQVTRLPPIKMDRLATDPPAGPCTSFSNLNATPAMPGQTFLGELSKECRRENRNPNLYRLATPLEISRIPEHLRNLRTIPLEPLVTAGDSEDEGQPPSPPPYYPPRPGKKKRSLNRSHKGEAYWMWEKPSKRLIPKAPPSACRILEEVRKAASQVSIQTNPPPPPPKSVVDVEEGQSESSDEYEDEASFQFEIVAEPPSAIIKETPKSIPNPHCLPKVKEIHEGVTPYQIHRGPKLLIKANKHEILLHQQEFDKGSIRPTQLFIDTFDDFETTSKRMETRGIILMNQGTTSIRFQWIRARPGRYTQKFLGNASKVLKFGKSVRRRQFPVALQQTANQAHQPECGEISSGPRKLGLHLTTSRKVNPALTRTIKILKNSVSASGGFQNFLLLLSLRVPRLKRELIRRTQRQLTSRILPGQIHDLYLQLRRQRRVRHHDHDAHSHQKRILGSIPDFTKEECTCSVSSESDSFQSDASENFYLFPDENKKYRPECLCVRPTSPIRSSTMVTKEWGPEDMSPDDIQVSPEDAVAPFYFPQLDCVCEGICICQPPAEDQGLCICGPNCICSPHPSWGILRAWPAENMGEGKLCACADPCTCVIGEDVNNGCPTTPPPSACKESTICDCDDPCDCAPSPRNSTCTCDITSGAPCDCGPVIPQCGQPRVICNCGPCDCDPPPEDYTCTCGPSCPCVTPPSTGACSQADLIRPCACACQPICICDPPPEDFCICAPYCTCVSPLPSHQWGLEELAPEDGTCLCPTCECDMAPREGFLGEGVRRSTGNDKSRGVRGQMDTTGAGDGPRGSGSIHDPKLEFNGEGEQLLGAEDDLHFYQDYFDLPPRSSGDIDIEEDQGEDNGPITLDQVHVNKPPPPKIHKTRKVEFLKEPSPEFIFCELPLILLPGQKYKFEIMFRPREPGVYSETIHLLTHPRLNATAYGIRLQGICINPPIPGENCKGDQNEPKPVTSSVAKSLYDKMYQRQGKQALTAIMDHVLHFQKKQKSTVPLGRVTTEAIFKAHNRDLHYYPGISERALEIVRTLVQLLVARTNIIGNPEICQRNIKKLYYQLLKSPSDQHYFEQHLNLDKVDELLQELSKCTQKLSQPPVFQGVSAEERCRTGTDASVLAMTDELLTAFATVEETKKNPFQIYIWRKVIKEKLEGIRTREIEQRLEKRRKEREAVRLAQKLDISTQTSSKEELVQEETTLDIEDDQDLLKTMPEVRNEDVEDQVQKMITESTRESRLEVAHEILSSGIERMLSFLDASANIHDYEPQHVIFHGTGGHGPGPDDTKDFCC